MLLKYKNSILSAVFWYKNQESSQVDLRNPLCIILYKIIRQESGFSGSCFLILLESFAISK